MKNLRFYFIVAVAVFTLFFSAGAVFAEEPDYLSNLQAISESEVQAESEAAESANTSFYVRVAGKTLVENGALTGETVDGVTIDPGSMTIYLNNCNIFDEEYISDMIYINAGSPVTMYLKGNNTITSGYYCICSYCPLTITGDEDAQLSLNGAGIYAATQASLTIKNTNIVCKDAGITDYYSAIVSFGSVEETGLNITNSNISVLAATTKTNWNCAINCPYSNISIKDSVIYCDLGDCDAQWTWGITTGFYDRSDKILEGGTLTVDNSDIEIKNANSYAFSIAAFQVITPKTTYYYAGDSEPGTQKSFNDFFNQIAYIGSDYTRDLNANWHYIRVTNKPVPVMNGISLTSAPAKTEYIVGEKLDLSNAAVTAKYSDGSSQDITSRVSWNIEDGAPLNDEGTIKLTASYGGFEASTDITVKEDPNYSIKYQTQIQNVGWDKYVKDGAESGTTGQSLRLETIRIKVNPELGSGDIQYKTHVQDIGWMDYVGSNQQSGTVGQSKRLEAIQIKLTDELADKYDVYYCVHAQNFGWMGWAKNDEQAGTAGYAYRLESIKIQLVKKGDPAPAAFDGQSGEAFSDKATLPAVSYRTHVQDFGWQSYVENGAVSGTVGQAKRLEGINIDLKNMPYDGGIEYRTHVQNIGWQDYVGTNVFSGTSGQSLRLEAIQIRLTGELADHYDVYYQVHAENYGWLAMAKNDEQSGTAGYAYRLEGIRILLVPKGSAAPAGAAGTQAEAFYRK